WQSLQQNLPATPVTDIKGHHGDLLVSTMGRSFWIMDDIAPLRQLAASVTKPSRTRTTDTQEGQVGPVGQVGREGQVGQGGQGGGAGQGGRAGRDDVVLAAQEKPSGATQRSSPNRPAAPVRAPIKPFDGSNVFLFTPAPAYRVHYTPIGGRPDAPEYPAAGARIDYFLASPSGDVKLEILDAAGTVVRSYTSAAPPAAQGGRGGRRGGGLPSALPTKVGMNRFVWDLRYGGTPAGGSGGNGPLVAPGTFRARLAAGGVTKTEPFTVKIDPRVAKDGVTVADLAEQAKFALK